jgi:hypothetical protein
VQTINTVQKYMYAENYKHHVQLLIMMIYRVCILNPTIYFLIKKKLNRTYIKRQKYGAIL